MTQAERDIWNEAVTATLKELQKWDGIIPEESTRLSMASNIYKRVAFKSSDPFESKLLRMENINGQSYRN